MKSFVLVFISFFMCIIAITVTAAEQQMSVNNILVEKNQRKMYLRHDDEILYSYDIALGSDPMGHKKQEGDGKTPEGRYVISGRNPASKYHLSLRISYPNAKDIEVAKQNKVSPGGDIMIHGLPNRLPSFLHRFLQKKDWTAGCIAVSNQNIEEIWDLVADGTPIFIKP